MGLLFGDVADGHSAHDDGGAGSPGYLLGMIREHANDSGANIAAAEQPDPENVSHASASP